MDQISPTESPYSLYVKFKHRCKLLSCFQNMALQSPRSGSHQNFSHFWKKNKLAHCSSLFIYLVPLLPPSSPVGQSRLAFGWRQFAQLFGSPSFPTSPKHCETDIWLENQISWAATNNGLANILYAILSYISALTCEKHECLFSFSFLHEWHVPKSLK